MNVSRRQGREDRSWGCTVGSAALLPIVHSAYSNAFDDVDAAKVAVIAADSTEDEILD